MKSWLTSRIPASAMLVAASVAWAGLISASVDQAPPPASAPPSTRLGPSPADAKPAPREAPLDAEGEELRTQAREDIAYLDAFLKAKKAQLREADLRIKATRMMADDLDRQKKRGLISENQRVQGELHMAAAQSDREMRAAELVEVEIRLSRAMRQLAAIERGALPRRLGMRVPNRADRAASLESEAVRLRTEHARSAIAANLR